VAGKYVAFSFFFFFFCFYKMELSPVSARCLATDSTGESTLAGRSWYDVGEGR